MKKEKVPYRTIEKVCDLADFALSYDPKAEEVDYLNVQEVRNWLKKHIRNKKPKEES